MSFKVIVNILSDSDNSNSGRETFNPLLKTAGRNHIARPRLEAQLAQVRRGQMKESQMRLLSKSLPSTIVRARAARDVWTAYHADALLAGINFRLK
jgi:hypothetical protein